MYVQLKKAQSKRQELSDQILQTAVINCDKEPAFEEKKTRLRLKVLELNDLKNDHSKRFEELSKHTQTHTQRNTHTQTSKQTHIPISLTLTHSSLSLSLQKH